MTDRDAFAAAALTGLLAAPTDKDRSWDYWARLAYEAADAMLAPRTKNGTGSGFEAGGPGHHISKAEIDALQHVVEDGQIVKMWDYARLRRLLIRLRPEWEDEPYEKSDEKRGDSNTLDRLAALERLSALDQELERTHGVRHTQSECTNPGDGIIPDSRNANEPVAWAVAGDNGDYAVKLCFDKASAQTEADRRVVVGLWSDDVVVPLYRHPQPTLTDAEREAIKSAIWDYEQNDDDAGCASMVATLRGLLERLS